MGEVKLFPGVEPHDVYLDEESTASANEVLDLCKQEDLESAIVIGYDRAGMFFFRSSIHDGPEVLWLLERLKLELMGS